MPSSQFFSRKEKKPCKWNELKVKFKPVGSAEEGLKMYCLQKKTKPLGTTITRYPKNKTTRDEFKQTPLCLIFIEQVSKKYLLHMLFCCPFSMCLIAFGLRSDSSCFAPGEQKQLRCFQPDSSQTPSQTTHLASFQENQTAIAFLAYTFKGETIISATCI